MKRIISILLCLIISISLCSCKELDELRDRQAFFDKDGIIYKEKLYKRVDSTENLNFDYYNDLNVTDKDVPVLLSETINFNYSINEEQTIICDDYESGGYIREDKYAEYEQSIKNGVKFTGLGFSYFDEQKQKTTEYILTKEERELCLSILKGERIERDFEYQDIMFLFETSDDNLFRRDDSYTILRCNNGYYFATSEQDMDVVYKSNSQTDKLFDSFFAKRYSETNYEFSI